MLEAILGGYGVSYLLLRHKVQLSNCMMDDVSIAQVQQPFSGDKKFSMLAAVVLQLLHATKRNKVLVYCYERMFITAIM